jgi:hypothetical protein
VLTEDETRLVAHAFALRHDEQDVNLWFAPDDDLFAEAERLWQRGYLDRRWHEQDLVYRLSDEAMTANELVRLTDAAAGSQN